MPDGAEERVLLRLRRLLTALAPSASWTPRPTAADLAVPEGGAEPRKPPTAPVLLPIARGEHGEWDDELAADVRIRVERSSCYDELRERDQSG